MSSSASRRAKAAEEKARRKLERETIVLEFAYQPGALRYHGPVIITGLGISAAHREALEKAGHDIPDPVQCRFLVDTGADTTLVKHEFAERAGLKLINDNVPIHGIGVDTTGRTYMGRIMFYYESKVMPGATHTVYVETQVASGTLKLPADTIDGVIGRDVLTQFQLVYDGRTGQVRMKYHRPAP